MRRKIRQPKITRSVKREAELPEVLRRAMKRLRRRGRKRMVMMRVSWSMKMERRCASRWYVHTSIFLYSMLIKLISNQ
tara:strand:- start:173 stop:406 length:234 start_codon:yes stop_codon:yes gene_type:complete